MRLVSAVYNGCYPFHNLAMFDAFDATTKAKELTDGDALVVWGGGDISPSLYGRECGKYTGASDIPSGRDAIEWNLMNRAAELGLPIIGVCRGAQMLCALAGGHLIQHIDGHGHCDHQVATADNRLIKTNSIHHQMMYPFDVEHDMLAWMPIRLSEVYFDVNTDVGSTGVPVEPECVWFPKVRGMAVQWHPEGLNIHSQANQWLFQQLTEKIYGE